MTLGTAKESKAKILQNFQQILAENKKIESKVETKEQEAEKAKNKQLLEVASTYTVDSIVKGLADLQLDFGSVINGLSERLSAEASKLDELKRGIEIETAQLQQLQRIRVVADALYILTQEHQEKITALEQSAASQREVIEKDTIQKRKIWEKEQQEFDIIVQERTALIIKEREQETADYRYELERTRTVATDEYEETKRKLERELQQSTREKEKNWVEREKVLSDNQAQFAENQTKAAGFEEELKQAYIKAKEEAIQEVSREAKVKADLVDKEWEGTKQGYELKVQSLQQNIGRQAEQIAEISAQLQATMKQSQDLAMKAFASKD
ncbi:MAG: hypothetical protein QQW96_20155 [Tychonema bourrellyi B0820]|uniref:Uncharacterized protein n=1 Tax=Tychonema bourrellyi FEM_GT703 TaxID=2040638 RepID=A0A2G4F2Z4_9CYAN|nr:hypothetical protein [Tychonema bourrellyi]MDQ2099951.1 hypothetical protein [Tychonema bourrellyi B0820]PHX56108.1 hypothetical protein CP500_007320 [Tychonema bourrellyi FEM_GT703]